MATTAAFAVQTGAGAGGATGASPGNAAEAVDSTLLAITNLARERDERRRMAEASKRRRLVSAPRQWGTHE